MKKIAALFLLLLLASFECYAAGPRSNMTNTEFILGTSDTTVLATNLNRGYLLVQNLGTDYCLVKFALPFTGTEGIKILAAGGYYEPAVVPADAVHVKCNSAGQQVEVIEGQF